MARLEPGVIECESAQRVVARLEPGAIDHESAQRAVVRLENGVIERESARRAVARLELGVIERESARRVVARARRTFDMACKYFNGNYLFHQPCGLWNEPCVHGCGYLHLSSSSSGTRKNVALMAACHMPVRTLMRN